MKKYIIASVLMLAILVPAVSFAQTTQTTTSTTTCVSLNNNLRFGSRDSATSGEVTILQNFLRSKNYLSVASTGYFGPLTLKGVKDFQRDNSITPIAGFVGPMTRAKIKSLTCDTPTPTPTAQGTLSVNPPSGIIKLGLTDEFQAMYQPPMPPCPAGFACPAVMPAPYAVRATWTSSNTDIATVEYKDTCPAGAQCLVYQPDYLIAEVTGVSEGSTVLTAKYTDSSGKLFTTSIPITVQYLIR